MALEWRDMVAIRPSDGQVCLVQMKHGIVQGAYCAEDDTFSIYLWRDVEFYGRKWVPIEEAL